MYKTPLLKISALLIYNPPKQATTADTEKLCNIPKIAQGGFLKITSL